jgi:hypothetical protein
LLKTIKILFLSLILAGTLVLTSAHSIFGSQTRLFSMGDLILIMEDEDNEINLWDFGQNPAWVVMDQKVSWGRGSTLLDREDGAYRRILDPTVLLTSNSYFDAVRTFGPDKVFFGYVGYYYYKNEKIVGSVEKYPYADEFGLLDSAGFVDVDKDGTIDDIRADFTYTGPDLYAGHARRISKNTFVGATIGYRLEHGVKRAYIWPETYLRTFNFNFGIAHKFPKGIVLGLSFKPDDTQERIDLDPGLQGGSIVKDVVGFQWRIPISTMTRTTRNKVYQTGLQGTWDLGRSLVNGFVLNYIFKSLEINDGLTDASRVVYWQGDGYGFEYRGLWRVTPNTLNLGFSYDRIYLKSWTKNPIFNTVLDEGPVTDEHYGVGVGVFPSQRFRCGTEAHFYKYKEDVTDYVSKDIRDTKIDSLTLSLGGEFGFDKNFWLRSGLIYAEYSVDGKALPEDILRDNNSFEIRLGFGYSSDKALIDLALGYNMTKGDALNEQHIIYTDAVREKLRLYVSSKFFLGK